VLVNVVYLDDGRGRASIRRSATFVGLFNYETLLACDNYPRSVHLHAPTSSGGRCATSMWFVPAASDDHDRRGARHGDRAETAASRARGFLPAAIFFFPVMLSPVVVAMNVGCGCCSATGRSMACSRVRACQAVSWLTEPSRRLSSGRIFVTVWAHMGFYMVILLAGLQSIPGRSLRGREDGPRLALAGVHAHHAGPC